MAVAIPPPHVPLAPGSNYLLDALVPVPIPFLFLSPTSSLYGGLFHLFLGLFVPLFGSSGFRRFTALRLRQVFYVPPPRHSLIATFLSGVPARSRLSLFRLIIQLFILCFLWFSYILSPLFIFCFAEFPCICFSISMYSFFCLFCVFFDFYSFTDLLCVCFAVLHPLPGLFPRLHRVELLTRPSVYGVYLHVIGFIFLYFFFVFAYKKSCLDQPALGCDAWSRSLGCGCERYLGFRVEEDKCWPGVPSP
jgi:hypothetical protein